ncbi:MAG: hypothetical protein M3261_01480 [Thermoproteota archaeon]|nr:hypothetical protein [Thermoproteota archaeon]
MKLKILIFILAAIIGFAAYLFFNRSNPVLYRHVDRASAQYSAFLILNPFRDRKPERQAEVVLQRLQSRNYQQALSLASLDSERVTYLCEREQKYLLESWSLMDYQGDGKKVRLIYNLYRNSGDGEHLSPPAWIDVEKINGEWQATSYETYY